MRRSLLAVLLFLTFPAAALAAPLSHPPLRRTPPASDRPLGEGPALYADAGRGDDRNNGSKESPWRTIRHAFTQLKPGDTLCLRAGTYHENVCLALSGRKDAPITIRSAPGEQAILDGGLREFFETPADAWEPSPGGAAGEYRSKKRYPNLRNVIGSFGDSMIGLQTYYHPQDLRAANELIDWEDWERTSQTDIKPLYCGPGLWYSRDTGHIHVRLAHTHLPDPIPNYRGETDPRKLPLVLAPFHSTPLTLDEVKHVRFQDLVIRGAGYTAIALDQAEDVEFDNVTVWCGAYGMRASGTRSLRIVRSGFYGSVAPWTFRSDTSKRDYPGRPHRNLSRLNTHAHIEIESGGEASVYATPQNDKWEIAHCEFTDAHDGPYLGGINLRFHHNLIENLQDDGLYLSPMYLRHRLDKTDPQIHIYENVMRQVLTALAFGGSEPETRDRLFICRNIIDLRGKVQTGRPSARQPKASFSTGKVTGDHGSPPWPAMNVYHNTFVMAEGPREAGMAVIGNSRARHPRRVFNNVFLHLSPLPGFIGANPADDVAEDGNLYWSPGTKVTAAALFQRYFASEQFAQSKKLYPAGSASHSLVADPKFVGMGDYRLREGSPAIDAGVALPEDWPDPLRKADRGKPDIGALPLGVPPLRAGRN